MKSYMGVDWKKYGIDIPHCLAPWKAAFIQADGFVRPCCIYPPIMGNTNEKNLEVIWNDEPYRKLRLAMLGKESMPEICATCHDSMRHIDIEWYLKHAIEERIDESASTHQLGELLCVLILKGYMILPAIYLQSRIYRKSEEYNRELYCLLSCGSAFDDEAASSRIKELRSVLSSQAPHDIKATIDAVFVFRLKIRVPDLAFEFEQMLGNEYSSVDEYMKDMDAIDESGLLARKRKKIKLEYYLYNNPVALERRMRFGRLRLRLMSRLMHGYLMFSNRTRWLIALPFRSKVLFLGLFNKACLVFNKIRK